MSNNSSQPQADAWKQIQDLFSPLIEKPSLDEETLKKPTFQILFEIIINTIKIANPSLLKLYTEGE